LRIYKTSAAQRKESQFEPSRPVLRGGFFLSAFLVIGICPRATLMQLMRENIILVNSQNDMDKNTEKDKRKIQKIKRSYYVTLPISYVREFGWDERRAVTIRKAGKKLLIEKA
jgi:hypothetical protein